MLAFMKKSCIMKPMMKLKYILTICVCCSAYAIASAESFLLEEQIVPTVSTKCKIIYLTEKNTRGWRAQTDRDECDETQFLNGYHRITMLNGFGKPVENLYGYFSNGYWTGNAHVKDVVFNRFSDELGIQKATFPIYTDVKNKIRFIAQMSTQKTTAGMYPAFKVCEPFRILGIVEDFSVLDKPQVLQSIFRTLEQETRRFCPTEKEVMLFFSQSEKPNQEDVKVFVNMDLVTHRHKILRAEEETKKLSEEVILIPSAQFKQKGRTESNQEVRTFTMKQSDVKDVSDDEIEDEEELLSDDISDLDLTNISGEPSVEKKETDTLKQKKQDEEKALTEKINREIEELTKQEKEKTEPVKKNFNKKAVQIPARRIIPAGGKPFVPAEPKNIVKQSPTDKVSSYFDTTKRAENFSQHTHNQNAKKKSYLKPFQPNNEPEKISLDTDTIIDVSDKNMSLSKVMLLARTADLPVLAQTAVHVGTVDKDGSGFIDYPTALIIESGSPQQAGWHFISGYFQSKKASGRKTDDNRGTVRIREATPCENEYCQDTK